MHVLPPKKHRLTPIAYVPSDPITGARNGYLCRCDCGNQRRVDVGDFKKGLSKSCGCYKRERMGQLTHRHGMSRSAEYRSWRAMINRCTYSKTSGYEFYGGRGITVCERWRRDFSVFLADVGPRPSANHSLDRTDNSLGYEPGNCSWRVSHAQSRNRRSTRIIRAFGKSQCVSDWANEYGITIACLFARLRKGIPIEAALTIPLNDCAALRAAVEHSHDHARIAK
jgi:hypothetical protein